MEGNTFTDLSLGYLVVMQRVCVFLTLPSTVGVKFAKGGTLHYCTSATEKVSACMGFYTKNSHFPPLIPLPTTEFKIR